jgi:hypothetical protein
VPTTPEATISTPAMTPEATTASPSEPISAADATTATLCASPKAVDHNDNSVLSDAHVRPSLDVEVGMADEAGSRPTTDCSHSAGQQQRIMSGAQCCADTRDPFRQGWVDLGHFCAFAACAHPHCNISCGQDRSCSSIYHHSYQHTLTGVVVNHILQVPSTPEPTIVFPKATGTAPASSPASTSATESAPATPCASPRAADINDGDVSCKSEDYPDMSDEVGGVLIHASGGAAAGPGAVGSDGHPAVAKGVMQPVRVSK